MRLHLLALADSENNLGGSSETMYYIGLDVHKKTISYCVKDAAGCVHGEGKIGSTQRELDEWVRTLSQPRMMAMEATIFTGWIYDRGDVSRICSIMTAVLITFPFLCRRLNHVRGSDRFVTALQPDRRVDRQRFH